MRLLFKFDKNLNEQQKQFWDRYLEGIDTKLYNIITSEEYDDNDYTHIIYLSTDTYPLKTFKNLLLKLEEQQNGISIYDNNKEIENYGLKIIGKETTKHSIFSNKLFFTNTKNINYQWKTKRQHGEQIYTEISEEELNYLIKEDFYFMRKIETNCRYKNKKLINYLESITSSIKGINRLEKIYIINLAHRKDRLDSIMYELKKVGTNLEIIERINAVHFKNFGAIGCGMSHCLALTKMIKQDYTNTLVLEDDFILAVEPDEFNDYINKLYNDNNKWDVVMLGANLEQYRKTQKDYLIKIEKARTTSGYIINKNIVSTINDNFKEACKLMRDNIGKMEEHLIKHNYAIDMYWQQHQPNSLWYCFNPRLGKQLPSYSDVENRFTSYGV